jgi:hypothetical protein
MGGADAPLDIDTSVRGVLNAMRARGNTRRGVRRLSQRAATVVMPFKGQRVFRVPNVLP